MSLRLGNSPSLEAKTSFLTIGRCESAEPEFRISSESVTIAFLPNSRVL
jgi:hypothetical protein